MAGNTDPVDAVAGLATLADVSKAGVRDLLKTGFLGIYPTGAEFAAADASGRFVVFIQEYESIYVKDTGDTTTATSEALVRDANGIAFRAINATAERVAFSAHKNGTNQTGVVPVTPTQVTFSSESFDEGGYFDTATGRFTPPAGKYILTACVAFSAGLTDQNICELWFRKNGTQIPSVTSPQSGTSQVSVSGCIIVDADGDDYFDIYTYAGGSGNKTISGALEHTWFMGAKIDGQRGADGTSLDYDLGPVADNTARDALVGVTAGQRVSVSDIGDGRSAVYELISAGPYVWSDPLIITGADGADGTSGTSALTRVRIVATANVAIATALENGDTLDGVVLATNDLVLLTAQSTTHENGVYVVAASGAAARHSDFDAYDELPGTFFAVMEGTAKADTLWHCTSNRGGTIGVTAVAISEFSSGGATNTAFTRVRVVATANVAIATALENGDTLDGVTLATGDLVLLTAQTAPEENGVYVVPASGAASRHSDFNAYDELPGTYFSVMEGTAKPDTLWFCTSNRGGTIGSTAIAISQFAVGGYISSEVLIGASVALTSPTQKSITSITLTTGRWQLHGNVVTNVNAATSLTLFVGTIHNVLDTLPTIPNKGAYARWNGSVTGSNVALSAGEIFVDVVGSETWYLTAQAVFTINTCAAYGFIGAQKIGG